MAHAPVEKRRFVLLKRGEVVVLHNWCLHRSETNFTDSPRRGFSVCYIDSATKIRGQSGGGTDSATGLWPQVFPDFVPVDHDDDVVRHVTDTRSKL